MESVEKERRLTSGEGEDCEGVLTGCCEGMRGGGCMFTYTGAKTCPSLQPWRLAQFLGAVTLR
jgi:hypothetical protein